MVMMIDKDHHHGFPWMISTRPFLESSDFEPFQPARACLKVLKVGSGDFAAAAATAMNSSVGAMDRKSSSEIAEPVPV